MKPASNYLLIKKSSGPAHKTYFIDADDLKPCHGTVLAVSDEVDSKAIPVGSDVLYRPGTTDMIRIGEKEYYLLRADDVLMSRKPGNSEEDLKCAADWLLVKVTKSEDESPEILTHSEGVVADASNKLANTYRAGTIIYFRESYPIEVKINGSKFILLHKTDILMQGDK